MWPDVSPFFQIALRDRLKYQASPLAMVFCSASSFMCATIRTSPDPASVTTAVTRPLASNLGVKARPSSMSLFAIDATRIEISLRRSSLPDAGPCNQRREIVTLDTSRPDLTLPAAQHRHEAHLLGSVVTERTGKMRGHRERAGFFDTPQRHAHVLGFNHHRDAAWFQ